MRDLASMTSAPPSSFSKTWGPAAFGLSVSVACTLILSACNIGGSSSSAPKSVESPTARTPEAASMVPDWSIHYRSTCKKDDGSVAPCPGFYGWIATSLKTVEVGPAPNSRVHQESLSEDTVNALASAIFTEWEIPEDSATCDANESPSGDAARIERLIDGNVITRCVSPAFLATLRPWVESTSPDPYPSPCWDALADLRDLQKEMQACRHDNDCAYFDPSFRPIEVGTLELVVTRTCDRVDPLWVANPEGIKAKSDAYLTLKGKAQQTCGANWQRPSCSIVEGFQAMDAETPSCVAGRCVRH